jgi:hypothetical protein
MCSHGLGAWHARHGLGGAGGSTCGAGATTGGARATTGGAGATTGGAGATTGGAGGTKGRAGGAPDRLGQGFLAFQTNIYNKLQFYKFVKNFIYL